VPGGGAVLPHDNPHFGLLRERASTFTAEPSTLSALVNAGWSVAFASIPANFSAKSAHPHRRKSWPILRLWVAESPSRIEIIDWRPFESKLWQHV
jgi:hypothetical protein